MNNCLKKHQMPLLDEEVRKEGYASVLSSQEVQADTSNHEPMKL